jgi:hypothetical protein
MLHEQATFMADIYVIKLILPIFSLVSNNCARDEIPYGGIPGAIKPLPKNDHAAVLSRTIQRKRSFFLTAVDLFR